MRKRVFKRKKKTIAGSMDKIAAKTSVKVSAKAPVKVVTKAMAFVAALSLMVGTVMTAYGEEAREGADFAVLKTVETDIFHRHIGSPNAGGGCYTNPIEHVHQGDAINGGGCYTKPVLHEHTGSPETGGGCYQKAIPHTQHGPECYRSETHTHGPECFTGRCTITYTPKEVKETYTDTCQIHGVTTHEKWATIASHSACGLGEIETEIQKCQSCTNSLTRTHLYSNCGKQEGTTQILECSKDIDGYEPSCGYEQDGIERYERVCNSTVDGYGLGCGLDEDRPCGRLILTSQAGSDSARVVISARVEDFTGGKLVLDNEPYVWRDQEGNILGNGESLEVGKNGDYSVTVSLKNKDVDESGLQGSISVDSIHKQEPVVPTVAPTATPTATATASATPSASIEPTATIAPTLTPDTTPSASLSPTTAPTATPTVAPKETPEATSSPAPVVVPEKTPEPSFAPESSPEKEDEETDTDKDKQEGGEKEGENENKNDKTGTDETEDSGPGSGSIKGAGEDKEALEKEQLKEDSLEDMPEDESNTRRSYYVKGEQLMIQPSTEIEEEEALASPSSEPEERIKKDTQKVTVSGNNAAQEGEYKVGQQTKKNRFFQSTAAKIITVTLSTLLAFAGIILFMLYLLCSVRIFNDDGEGRMIYLGRLLVRKKDEEYSLMITEAMTEKSCTNRYCIKPGFFRLGKKEDQELIVYRDTKKAVTYLNKEMIVIL